MLSSLSIRNFVLIDRLDLSLEAGLCVFSGETGTGKSIILDALGLALGRRAEANFIRQGCERASVAAGFQVPNGHPVEKKLFAQGLAQGDNDLILRRVLSRNGRSRAYINDNLVSIGLLSDLASDLVEVHGQHDEQGLLQPSAHRALLDEFGDYEEIRSKVRAAHRARQAIREELDDHKNRLVAAERDEQYDRHCLEELVALDPGPEDEARLAEARNLMMQSEQISTTAEQALQALTGEDGPDARLRSIIRRIEEAAQGGPKEFEPILSALQRAAIEIEEAERTLSSLSQEIEMSPAKLEEIEERLFALRSLARKHGCEVGELVAVKDRLEERVTGLKKERETLSRLEANYTRSEQEFDEAVAVLTRARTEAAKRLDRAVNKELKPLKLERARFRTSIQPLESAKWGRSGGDSVAFEISTNRDRFGPLAKIASGGELARFVLALKVVLAGAGSSTTLIFDEVDRGVGGATASAVGNRLARLSSRDQVLIVTHSPQVAARADHHWLIIKEEAAEGPKGGMIARVSKLDGHGRQEELARMLAGMRVTDEARAAAAKLMEPEPGRRAV